ncbi:MAG TPA: Kdo hydroxylase family protein [Methylomirabilota bacterium]|nr:Kdo hydroxylase family protein [Methylomirabilota bacterium]
MVEIVELDGAGAGPRRTDRVLGAIEDGAVVYMPGTGFTMTNREHRFLDPGIVRQPRVHSGRARIIYLPTAQRLLKTTLTGGDRDELQAMMGRFSDWAKDLVLSLLPDYAGGLKPGPATFRPCPRSGPQRLHVDSFFFFPTEGRRVLRVLTNIDPEGRPRVWQFGDEAFEPFARRLMPQVRRELPGAGWLLKTLGVTKARRTPYDHIMRQLRNITKIDRDYQQNTARKVVEFPTGSSWLLFTDNVLHGALKGQYAFEQTFWLDVAAMRDPARSPLRVLERLQARKLA